MSSSFDWMPNGGAPLLPRVSPYCVPERQMELKRRPTLYDIRGSGWQLRHYKAPIDAEVPWERVHFWPSKDVHMITDQEIYQPPMPKMTRTRTKTVAQKGPKVVKAPPTPVRQKKVAPKFAARYDYWRVFNYVNKLVFGAQAGQGAVQAAPADVVPTTAPITDPLTLPGAIAEDDAAADVDAQTESAADDEAQPSLLAAIFKFGVDFVLGQRKRAHEDDNDDISGDAKRRRVGSDAQAPSCAEARPAAGNAACKTTTGTTVPKYHCLTAVAAQRRDRRKPKPSLALCPPPTDASAAGEGNAKVPPPPARPIAGRPTRRRADTPDPRVGTPPPSEREASSAPSTPTSSPSSSRVSTPERERSPSPSPSPSPAPKSSKSKSKSKSSSSKSTSSTSQSKSKSSECKSSSDSELSSSKSKSSSKPKMSSDKSKSSSSGSKSSSASTSSSSKSQSSSSKTQASSSKTQPSSSKSGHAHKSSSRRSSTEHTTDAGSRTRARSGTEIMLYPHFIYWNRDDKLANPWDPRCAAAPDPRFPWAPTSAYWANVRTAPIAPLPDPPSPPSFKLERAPANPLYPSAAARRHRSPSPVPVRERECEEFSGAETEVESGGEETDCEE